MSPFKYKNKEVTNEATQIKKENFYCAAKVNKNIFIQEIFQSSGKKGIREHKEWKEK